MSLSKYVLSVDLNSAKYKTQNISAADSLSIIPLKKTTYFFYRML